MPCHYHPYTVSYQSRIAPGLLETGIFKRIRLRGKQTDFHQKYRSGRLSL